MLIPQDASFDASMSKSFLVEADDVAPSIYNVPNLSNMSQEQWDSSQEKSVHCRHNMLATSITIAHDGTTIPSLQHSLGVMTESAPQVKGSSFGKDQ